MKINSNYSNQNDHHVHVQLEYGDMTNKDYNPDNFQYLSSQNRKRRNEQSNQVQVPSTNSTYARKRRNSDHVKQFSSEKHNIQGRTTTSSSYFNDYSRSSSKQTYESSVQK